TRAQVVGKRAADRLERAPRIAEQLAGCALSAELRPPQDELRPEPRERDPFGVLAELPEHERSPNGREGVFAARPAQPRERTDVVHALPVAPPHQAQDGKPKAQPLERRKRRVRKEIARTDERPDPPARVHAHRRAMPLERAREQLVVQRDHLAVAAEQMVVVALHENAAAGVFFYAAQRVLRGGLPYRDIWDHKPPGVYAIDAIGLALGGTAGVWGVQLVSLVVAAVASLRATRTFGGGAATFGTFAWLVG